MPVPFPANPPVQHTQGFVTFLVSDWQMSCKLPLDLLTCRTLHARETVRQQTVEMLQYSSFAATLQTLLVTNSGY